jgi:hypothetical protein
MRSRIKCTSCRVSPNWRIVNCQDIKFSKYESFLRVSKMLYCFIFVPCINSIKNTFIVPTDAHCYKIVGMLKTIFKIIILAPTCFGSRRNHHQGVVLYLTQTTNMFFSVLVGVDTVNVMAAYQPVVRAYGSHCEPHACTTGRYAAITLTASTPTSTEKKHICSFS